MDFEEYKKIMDIQYDLLIGLYFDKKILNNKFKIFVSDIIKDNFWNIAILENENVLDDETVFADIDKQFANIGRQPCIYIPQPIEKHKGSLQKNGYNVQDTDSYMFFGDNNIGTEITDTVRQLQTDEQYDDFMNVMASGYSGEVDNENPYAGSITPEYYEAIKRSMNNKKFNHMILYKDGIAVSVATISYENGYGVINNVATRKDYWNLGLGKQLMQACVNKFNELGGGELFLVTEKGSKNEAWYTKLGFKTRFIIEQYVKNS